MSGNFIYFDNINTTFPDEEVVACMEQALHSKLGNPSAHIHSAGIDAARLLDNSRAKVAALIGAQPDSVIFTSGATEANNLAISGFMGANPDYQLAVLSIEHFSIINQARKSKLGGRNVLFIDVDRTGLANLEQLAEFVRSGPTLVSIAYANPEIGTVQQVEQICRICRDQGATYHCDATVAASTHAIDVGKLGIDLLTLSGHNIYGPTGIGALFIEKGVNMRSLFEGGNQEHGIRPGTENIVGAVGFGKACEMAVANRMKWSREISVMGCRLWQGLSENVPFIHLTGHPEKRLAGHVSFWVEHIEGESILLLLNMKGFMAASGSACSSNLKGEDETDLVASHVLTAVGVPADICAGSLTLTLGKYNTIEEVESVINIMPGLVEKLLAMSPSYSDYMRKKE